ncbi:MAG: DUF99 family protein [Ferroplasma sp.]
MKKGLRILGIDDGPFKKGVDRSTVLVGVLIKFNSYIEGISIDKVQVDGNDSGERIVSLASGRFRSEINFIMTDGITFGGFNIMDIEYVYERTGIPVISVARRRPDIGAMVMALKKHFDDYEARISIINKSNATEISSGGKNIYINYHGISLEEAKTVVKNSTVMGNMPEPVRIAHIIASAIINGESYGRP